MTWRVVVTVTPHEGDPFPVVSESRTKPGALSLIEAFEHNAANARFIRHIEISGPRWVVRKKGAIDGRRVRTAAGGVGWCAAGFRVWGRRDDHRPSHG